MDKNGPLSLRIGAGAHRGLVREDNQDRISRIQSPFGELFIVADGMGGHEGGGTAAQMLIDGLAEHLSALPPETPPDEALRQAAQQTNTDINRRAQGDRQLARMGATCVLALVQGHHARIAHAGDSRAYLWRDGQLERLTRDHTLVQRMVDHQILNEEEARHHPDAHVVTRGFGQSPEVELEIAPPLELHPGDRLLLCSDGLSGYVDDAAIARALAAEGETQAIADTLIDLALRAGGEDNVSLQLLAVQDPRNEAAQPVPPPRARELSGKESRRGLPTFFLLLPLFLAAFLAGILLPWRGWLGPEPAESTAPPTTDLTDRLTDPADPTDLTDPYAAPSGPDPEARPPVIESSPPIPRVSILLPAGATAPDVKQYVLRGYPGNWSTPEPVAEDLAAALQDGRVYFRPGFDNAAADLAGKLGYAAEPWPPRLGSPPPEVDLLVIHRRTP